MNWILIYWIEFFSSHESASVITKASKSKRNWQMPEFSLENQSDFIKNWGKIWSLIVIPANFCHANWAWVSWTRKWKVSQIFRRRSTTFDVKNATDLHQFFWNTSLYNNLRLTKNLKILLHILGHMVHLALHLLVKA